MLANGDIIYSYPTHAEITWKQFVVRWNESDYYPDIPDKKAQYPSLWTEGQYHDDIMDDINDHLAESEHPIKKTNNITYIHDLTLDDLSVFNWTTKEWENLHDETKWRLEIYPDRKSKQHGFVLRYLPNGMYSYDMILYLNKKPKNMKRMLSLKKNAILNVSAVLVGEVDNPAIRYSVNTSRNIVVRKLFPYAQTDVFSVGNDNGKLQYEMNIHLHDYPHYKNQILLQDITIFNRSTMKFEDVLDSKRFRVSFKDNNNENVGEEINTYVTNVFLNQNGESFIDGIVYGYNEEYDIHLIGEIEANYDNGSINLTPKTFGWKPLMSGLYLKPSRSSKLNPYPYN